MKPQHCLHWNFQKEQNLIVFQKKFFTRIKLDFIEISTSRTDFFFREAKVYLSTSCFVAIASSTCTLLLFILPKKICGFSKILLNFQFIFLQKCCELWCAIEYTCLFENVGKVKFEKKKISLSRLWNIKKFGISMKWKKFFSFKITSKVADQRTNDYLTHSGTVTRWEFGWFVTYLNFSNFRKPCYTIMQKNKIK